MITIIKKPDAINPVFADNTFSLTDGSSVFYTFTFVGDVKGSFKIYANKDNICSFNVRYILESYVHSQIAVANNSTIMKNGLREYSISVKGSENTEIAEIGKFKFYGGALQSNEENSIRYGSLMNNVSKEISVHKGDELTLTHMRENGLVVTEINTLQDSDFTVMGVDISIKTKDPRFIHKRFAYVNNHGATDYVDFSLATEESFVVNKLYYENKNRNIVSDIGADQIFIAHSAQMTEQQSINLKSLWTSPLVVLIEQGRHYEVNILNRRINILQNKSKKSLSYAIEFKYSSNYNTQK